MKFSILALALSALPFTAVHAATPNTCSVSLSQEPVVMRIGKDEFRIAFGVNGEKCHGSACTGSIKYQASWKTEDGSTQVDHKLLTYNIPDGATRSIAVDRHYFDTAEGKHTTEIVHVSVDQVSCANGTSEALAKR
jgi:hypothetical protein